MYLQLLSIALNDDDDDDNIDFFLHTFFWFEKKNIFFSVWL